MSVRLRCVRALAALASAVTLTSSASPSPDAAVYPGQGLFAFRDGSASLTCTAAFVVESNTTRTRGVLTAGHCVYMGAADVVGDGSPLHLGSESDLLELVVSQDRLTENEWERDGAVLTLPAGAFYTARVGGRWEVGDTITARELRESPHTRVCKLGAVTGLTCGEVVSVTGEFVTVADMHADSGSRVAYRGDSGAPMFVFDGNTVRPVAVVSHGTRDGDDLDPRFVTGQLIAPLLEEWNLSMVPR